MRRAILTLRWFFGVISILSVLYSMLLWNFWPNSAYGQYATMHRLTCSIAAAVIFTILFFITLLDFWKKSA